MDRHFIPAVISHPDFVETGTLQGSTGAYVWVVVDPVRHPLCVWQQGGEGGAAYGKTALSLHAALFTNGPMMGRRLAGRWKVTRKGLPLALLVGTGLGAGLGALGSALIRHGKRGRLWSAMAGGAAGAATIWQWVFRNWIPCGAIRGATHAIDDERNFDQEGATHSWFGRKGSEFFDYAMGDGDLPPDMFEGMGGLTRLIRNYEIPSRDPANANYNAGFDILATKHGIVAWALVPLPTEPLSTENRSSGKAERQTLAGVLVAIGSRKHLDGQAVANRLCAMGARDAVATDQRGAVMLGTDTRFLIGPPLAHRQKMQKYGLYCQ